MKNQILSGLAAMIAISLLVILTGVSKSPEIKPTANQVTDPQVNLALREIGDRLLRQQNDFKTLIPPVCQEADGSYLLTIRQSIDYAQLRSVVDQVLVRHNIHPDYRLSLLDCENNQVLLGFLARPQDTDKAVACQDRDVTDNCYNLRIALNRPDVMAAQPLTNDTPFPYSWLLLGLAIGVPMLWMAARRSDGLPPVAEDDGWMAVSDQTTFHPANQQLRIAGEPIDLTYREAKLLHYFFEHPQQVLEREQILEAVWGDEGVIVGRSLDVFVSRLRKKLQADPALQLVSVHGVGYKLMIEPNAVV